MPPQKVVSSRITSTAVSSALAASCSKFTTTVLVASGTRIICRAAPHPVQAEDRVFQVIVVQVLNRLSETDGLLGGPHAVGIESEPVPVERRGQGAVAFQFVVRRKNAALQFMGGEAAALFEARRARPPIAPACALRRSRFLDLGS